MPKATKALGVRLGRRLSRLVKAAPRTPTARALSARAEHELMIIVKAGGKPAADRALKAIRLGSQRLTKTLEAPGTSTWSVLVDETAPAPLEVWFSAGRIVQMTSVRYGAEPKPTMTRVQRARHETQEAFYKRYMQVGQRWYRGKGPRRLPHADNLILLIGELEADVNNGGFSQYLDNKGLRRARSALAALRTVGAKKTAAMLSTAMSPGVSEKRLGALDARFYKVPEDLALFTMRYLATGRSPR